jgi:hypothetical protein
VYLAKAAISSRKRGIKWHQTLYSILYAYGTGESLQRSKKESILRSLVGLNRCIVHSHIVIRWNSGNGFIIYMQIPQIYADIPRSTADYRYLICRPPFRSGT